MADPYEYHRRHGHRDVTIDPRTGRTVDARTGQPYAVAAAADPYQQAQQMAALGHPYGPTPPGGGSWESAGGAAPTPYAVAQAQVQAAQAQAQGNLAQAAQLLNASASFAERDPYAAHVAAYGPHPAGYDPYGQGGGGVAAAAAAAARHNHSNSVGSPLLTRTTPPIVPTLPPMPTIPPIPSGLSDAERHELMRKAQKAEEVAAVHAAYYAAGGGQLSSVADAAGGGGGSGGRSSRSNSLAHDIDVVQNADSHAVAEAAAAIARGESPTASLEKLRTSGGSKATTDGGGSSSSGDNKKEDSTSSANAHPDATLNAPAHPTIAFGEQDIFAPAMPPPQFFDSVVTLGLPEDKYWLSELQCYLRSNFVECFGATDRELGTDYFHGRNKPTALGQVGIRCRYCRDLPFSQKGPQSVSYPSMITGIYNSVQQMFRLHLEACTEVPPDVREKLETLRDSSSSRGGRKQYWVDSARRLGLCDTPHGIHYGRDPTVPPPPLEEGTVSLKGKKGSMVADAAAHKIQKAWEMNGDGFPDDVDLIPEVGDDGQLIVFRGERISSDSDGEVQYDSDGKIKPTRIKYISPDRDWERAIMKEKESSYPLVLPEDSPLISDYLYLTMEQMEPCKLMKADQTGCYKGRPLGFPGLSCRHCIGQAGCGRYFPASEASLSQTTTSQTILNHVRNCRKVPAEIRENLEAMKKSNGKKSGKPKHGGRKVFFHRLWCRIQGIQVLDLEDDVEVKIGRQKGAKNKRPAVPKRKFSGSKKRLNHHLNPDGDSDSSSTDSDDDTVTDDDNDFCMDTDGDDGYTGGSSKKKRKFSGDFSSGDNSNSESGVILPYSCIEHESDVEADNANWAGVSVSLGKIDDPLWLSEAQCFMRSEMLDIFSSKHAVSGQNIDVAIGQVGIRCVYCEAANPGACPVAYACYPKKCSSIYNTVTRFHRDHLRSCQNVPDDVKATYSKLKTFGSKAENETKQYWIDAAREIGVSDRTTDGGDAHICFHRNPLSPSPVEDLAQGRLDGKTEAERAALLVRPEDKGMVTDFAALLLRQVRRCGFKNSDKRGGAGARARDRKIGFGGLACIHCDSRNNNIGRYFPLTAKHLADNTANSIMSHIQHCLSCPEPIKASLSYLEHRGILQKSEIGTALKKKFYKRLWERIHKNDSIVTRGDAITSSASSGPPRLSSSTASSSRPPRLSSTAALAPKPSRGILGKTYKANQTAVSPPRKNTRVEKNADVGLDSDDESDDEEAEFDEAYVRKEMGDLITRAAIWLTAQDNAVRVRGRPPSNSGSGRGKPLATQRIYAASKGSSSSSSISPGTKRARLGIGMGSRAPATTVPKSPKRHAGLGGQDEVAL